MLFELLYYYPIVTCIHLASYLFLEYISDPDMFQDNMKLKLYDLSMWSIEKYNVCRDKFMKTIYPHISSFMGWDVYTHITFYNPSNGAIDTCNNLPCNIVEHLNDYLVYYNNFSVNETHDVSNMFIQIHDLDTLKSIQDKNNISLSDYVIHNPFIQFELHCNDNIYDISSFVKDYCVKNNVFNHTFYCYIMKTHHSVDNIGNDYTIKCMDQNITLKTFTPTQKITITNDGYTVHDTSNDENE